MGANYEKDVTTEAIIGCCFDVHTQIGPGFNEKIYHNALKLALEEKGIKYESEKDFPVNFKGKKVGTFRCDLFINEEVILELKAVTGILPGLFSKQLLSYLKASKIKTGLLINFGNPSCEVKRFSV